jgi:hypothetical protein
MSSLAWAEISVWEGDAQHLIYNGGRSLRFLSSGTLKIDCFTAQNELDDIDVIDAPGVNGPVYLFIAPNPNDPNHSGNDGARHVHVIDLSGATESYIVQVNVCCQMADWDRPLKATSITDEIVTYGTIVNGVDVQRLDGGIFCGGLGDVYVRDGSGATHAGWITVFGTDGYSGTIDVQGSIHGWIAVQYILYPGASITVHGTAYNGVIIGSMYGPVAVTGDMYYAEVGDFDEKLTVGGSLIGGFPGLPWGLRVHDRFGPNGYVDVTGDFWNPLMWNVPVQGRIEVDGTLIGNEIYGVTEAGSIQANNISTLHMGGPIHGAMSATQALTNVQIVAGVSDVGTVSAANISDLTISAAVVGTLTAAEITNLGVAWGVSGTVSATSFLSYSELGSVFADGTVTAPYIDHLTVSDAVAGTVSATAELTSSTFGGIDPNGFVETVYIRDVTVGGTVAGKLTASGTLDGSVQVGSVASTGTVDVGTLAGTLGFISNMYGSVDVTGDLTGAIWIVPTVLRGPDGNLFGGIVVGGDVTGTINVQGNVEETGSIYVSGVLDDVNSDLSGGHILISRSMLPGATITVAPGQNFDPDTEFVTGRFEGWASGESGYAIDPNATVTIGNYAPCHGDCPEVNIRAVAVCRGDVSNDGFVDFDDIGPFIEALGMTPEEYSLTYPGLGGTADNYASGARLFHGDCNCDGLFDFDDINPFVERISGNICDPGCPGDEQMMGAPQLAAGMRAHVPAARLPALRAFVAQVIAHEQNAEKRAYWQQVRAALEQ